MCVYVKNIVDLKEKKRKEKLEYIRASREYTEKKETNKQEKKLYTLLTEHFATHTHRQTQNSITTTTTTKTNR